MDYANKYLTASINNGLVVAHNQAIEMAAILVENSWSRNMPFFAVAAEVRALKRPMGKFTAQEPIESDASNGPSARRDG